MNTAIKLAITTTAATHTEEINGSRLYLIELLTR